MMSNRIINKGGSAFFQFGNDPQTQGFFTRTTSGASQTTFTVSAWVFWNQTLSLGVLLSTGDRNASGDFCEIYVNDSAGDPSINIVNRTSSTTTGHERTGTAAGPDDSDWHHVFCVIDTTQATDTDRFRVWWDGSELTTSSTSSSYFSLSQALEIGSNQQHRINAYVDLNTNPSDQSLMHFYYLDGVTGSVANFRGSNANGDYPINYTGSFGSNGFHLNFKSPDDLGNDVSGNNNDWADNSTGASPNVQISVSLL